MIRYCVLAILAIAVSLFSHQLGSVTTEFRGNDYALSQPGMNTPSRVWKQDRPVDVFTMRFEARVDGTTYGNFFQTSDGDKGMRLEVQPSGKMFLVLSESDLVEVDAPWKVGEWHRYEVTGTRDGGVDIVIDGRPALHSGTGGAWNFDNVAVGGGMALKRGFEGNIRGFGFTVRGPHSLEMKTFVGLAGLLSVLYVLVFVVMARRVSTQWGWGGPTGPAAAAVILALSAWVSCLNLTWTPLSLRFSVAIFALFVVAAGTVVAAVDGFPWQKWRARAVLGGGLVVVATVIVSYGDVGSDPSPAFKATRWIMFLTIPLVVAMWAPLLFNATTRGRRLLAGASVVVLGMVAVETSSVLALQNGTLSAEIIALAILLSSQRWDYPNALLDLYRRYRSICRIGAALVLAAVLIGLQGKSTNAQVMLLIFLQSVFWTGAFALLCWMVGYVFPRSWLFTGPLPSLQRILLGFVTLVIVLRLPYREDLPLTLGSLGVSIFVIWSVIKGGIALRTASTRRLVVSVLLPKRTWAWWILAVLPGLTIVYFPMISREAIFFQNLGPDLDGDLISTSYVSAGHTLDRLLEALHAGSGSFEWWNLDNHPWALPDFREGIAIEFFVRSLRWGHALLSAGIAQVSGHEAWFGFFVLVVLSVTLCPLIIVDAMRQRGISLAVAVPLAVAVTGGQTYALMLYEGIAVQLIAMPLMLMVVTNANAILLDSRGLKPSFVLALLLSGIVSTFGEGIQILTVFTVTYLAFLGTLNRHIDVPWGGTLRMLLTVGGLWIAISPPVFFDFVLWSYARLRDAFIGGALHLNWSVLSLLLPLPYAAVEPKDGMNLELLFGGSQVTRLVEIAFLGVVAAVLARRRDRGTVEFFATLATLTVFVLVNHLYAIWKVAAIMQPLFLICLYQVLPSRIWQYSKTRLPWVLASAALVSLGLLLGQYDRIAVLLRPSQFSIDDHLTEGKTFAFVTPSKSRIYFRLGSRHELYWANGGWRPALQEPNFFIAGASVLPVALYFDCDAEGLSRCQKIASASKGQLVQRTIYPTAIPIRDLLDDRGFVRHDLLDRFILEHYGVVADGGERHPD